MGGPAERVDAQRKHAYRWLLYWAMLDIRPRQWFVWGWRQRLNPFRWWIALRRVRQVGYLAEWLHNLARFSALDFVGFAEETILARLPIVARQIPRLRL